MGYLSTTINKIRYLVARDNQHLLIFEKNNGAFIKVALDTPEDRDAAISAAIGDLAVGSVGGLSWKGPWAATTDYITNDVVVFNAGLYRAPTDFTSGGSFDPTNWLELVPQNGIFLRTAQNLADLGSVTAARGNLGLGSAALRADTYFDTPAARDTAISTAITNLLNGVPGALDTLNELAAALGDDPNFATTVTTALSNRLSWKGVWAATTAYVANDVVVFNGGLYRAPGGFTSGSAFNKANWLELVPQTGAYALADSTGGVSLRHKLASNGDEPGAAVVFSPDDGYTQQVADVATLNALGIPVAFNLTRGWVDQAGTNLAWNDTYITTAQVQAIVDHPVGNEITYHDNGNHASQSAYLAAHGPAAFEAYVADFKAWALSTFGVTVRTGAYPAGLSNARTREVISRQLDFCRGTKGVVSGNPPNPHDVPGIDILLLDEATCKSYIDTAVANRALVNFLWHGGATDAFRTKLTNLVAYCQSLGVPMLTFYQAMSQRASIRGTSHMIDAQGNSFSPSLRGYEIELMRDDQVNEKLFIGIDETSNAAYIDTLGGTPTEARKRWTFKDIVRLTGPATGHIIQPDNSVGSSAPMMQWKRSAADPTNPDAVIVEIRYGYGPYIADRVSAPGTISGGIVLSSSAGKLRVKGGTPDAISGSSPLQIAQSITAALAAVGIAVDSTTPYTPAPDVLAIYTMVRERGGSLAAAVGASASRLLAENSSAAVVNPTATTAAQAAFYLDPADFAVADHITKLRLRANVQVNDTAPGTDITLSLKPWTNPAGAVSGTVSGTLGAAVAGSSVTILSAALVGNAQVHAESGDFDIPAAGWYVIGFGTTATTPANSTCIVKGTLSVKNI